MGQSIVILTTPLGIGPMHVVGVGNLAGILSWHGSCDCMSCMLACKFDKHYKNNTHRI